MDKLFFLDKENRGKKFFYRPLVVGEELPYRLDVSATVRVLEHAREFIVFDKQTLIIEEPVQVRDRVRAHDAFGMADIRGAYAKIHEEADKKRPSRMQLTDSMKEERRSLEHARQDERRRQREQKREGIRAVKRIERLNKMAQRRQGRNDATGQLADTVVENIPTLIELAQS